MNISENKCPVCGVPAHSKCSACYLVSYCSPAHQKEDWKAHRKNCSSFVIKDDPELGKGFIASRDIKAGVVILDEKPAVQATTWNQPSFFPFPSCMTCGLLMTFEFGKHCSKCKWPVCSRECEELSIHAENECQMFSSKKITYPPPVAIKPSDLRVVIILLRACVLKWKNPDIYEKILKLQSKFHVNEFNDWSWETQISQLKLFVKPENLGIDNDELTKLLKIFRINCHSTLLDDPESESAIFRSRSVGYLYIKASRMNHSCVPNCSWMVSGKPEFKIRIRTTVPVKKGDTLSIDYYLRETLYGTKQRQEFIRKGGFLCKCARCMDPTELGTFMSAAICSFCKEASSPIGYLLPEDPLDLRDSAPWKCNRCGNVKLALEILPNVEKIGRMISKKDKEFGDNSDDDSFNSLLTFCKSVVSKYSGKTLHPNHWVLQDASRAALRYLTTHRMNKMDLEMSQYYVKCGLYLLSIEDVVSPGFSLNRANLQRQLAIALHDQVAELCTRGKYQEAVNNLEQCATLRAEAISYFQTEFAKADGSNSKADVMKLNMELAMEEKNQILLQLMQARPV